MVSPKLKKCWEWILAIAVAQFFKLLGSSILGVIFAYVSSEAVVGFFTSLQAFKWLIFAFFLAIICFFLYWLFSKSEKQPSLPPVDPDFKILERHISYKWTSENSVEYKRGYKFKALKNVLDRYSDRWNWTGSGSIEIKSLIKAQSIHLDAVQGIWKNFDIKFNRILNKNDIIDSEVLWDIKNIAEKPSPFCSATIQEPTSILKIKVTFPIDFNVQEVLCEHMPSMSSKEVISTEVIKIDRGGVAEWVIPNPLLLHHYQMRWHWVTT